MTSKALLSWISLASESLNVIASVLWWPNCSARIRSQHIFLLFTAVVVCSQAWSTLCVFHRTFPCGVCFLWGFSTPVTVLNGGYCRNARVDCGSRGRPRQTSLAWSWEVCVRVMIWLSSVSFSNLSPIKPASQTLVRIVIETKCLQGKSARNRKRESQREGSYFCGGFGRWDSVKSLENDGEELGKEEWILPCGTKV